LAYQAWFKAHLELLDTARAPRFPDAALIKSIENDTGQSKEERAQSRDHYARVQSRALFISTSQSVDGLHLEIPNLHLNRCFGCSSVSVWIADALVAPAAAGSVQAAADVPEDVRVVFDEAAKVIDSSPAAAAALLRLALQKLLVALGGAGKSTSIDAAALSKKGLDLRIQRAMEGLRVIGGDAVQPGHISLQDDRTVALRLFQLINLIVNTMITQPRLIEAVLAGANSLKEAALLSAQGD
jgi:hypothetical protein